MPSPIRQIVRVEVEAPGYARTLDEMNARLEKNADAAGKLDQSLKGVGQGAAPGVQAATAALTAQEQAVAAANAEYERLRAEIVAVNAAIASARSAYNGLGADQKKQRAEAAANIASLENERRQLQGLATDALKSGRSFDTMGQATGSASSVLIESGRIVNDLSAGAFGGLRGMLIAVSNNFEGFITRGQAFVRASGGWRGAARSLVVGFMGPAGLAFALQAVATAFVLLGSKGSDSLKKIGDEAEKQRDKVRGFIDSVLQLQGLDFETGVVLTDPGQLRQLLASDQARLDSARNRLDVVKEEREELLRLQRTASQAQGRAVSNVSGQIFSSADAARLRQLSEEQRRLNNTVAQAEASYAGTREQLERVNRQTERRNQLLQVEGAKTVEQVRAEQEAQREAERQANRTSSTSSTGGGGPSAEDIQERRDAERAAAAAFAAETERRLELEQAAGAAHRAAVEARQKAEADYTAVAANLAEHRAAMTAQEVAAVQDYLAALAEVVTRTTEVERALGNAVEEMGRFATLPPVVSPESAQKLEELEARFEKIVVKAPDVAGPIVTDLEAAVGLADDLSRLFSEMGQDVLSDLTRSIGDAVYAVQRLRDVRAQVESGALSGNAGTFATIGAFAGIASGIVGGITSLAGAIEARADRERELRMAVDDAARATEMNTRALLSGQVGTDLRAADLERFLGTARDLRGSTRDNPTALGALLDQMEAAGYDVSNFRQMADPDGDGTINRDQVGAVLDALIDRLGSLSSMLGGYTDDLAGALARLADDVRYGGLSAAEAFDRFVEHLRGAGVDKVVDSLLDDLAGLAPGSEEFDAVLQQFYRDVQAGLIDLPDDMSQADLEALLDALFGLEAAAGAAAGALGAFEYTDDVAGALQAFADRVRYQTLEGEDAVAAFFDALRSQGQDVGDFAGVLDAAGALDLATDAGRDALRDLVARVFDQIAGGTFDTGDMTADEVARLLAALQSLGDGFGALADTLGNYTDDATGALAEFADAVRYAGLEGAAAIREWSRLLLASGEDLGGLADLVANAGDMTDAERVAAVAAIWEAIQAGGFDLGSLSDSEARQILDALLGFSDGLEDRERGTQATSISTATVGQVDTLLAYQQEQLRTLRAQLAQQIRAAELLAQIRASVAGSLAPALTASAAGTAPAVEVHGGGVTIDGIVVHAGPEFTRDDVRRVLPAIEEGLARRARAPKVNRSLTR